MSWQLSDIGDLTGKTIMITGPTSGIGKSAAMELAKTGAKVVLAARNPEKIAATKTEILAAHPTANLAELVVDISSQKSIREAATKAAEFGAIEVLINNAGIMGTPRALSADGIEMQLATNHLGPFLLTGLLLPQLAASGSGRVVALASQMHRIATKAPTYDPKGDYATNPISAYAESKLANLLFTYELDRRLRQAGLPVKAVAAHPGYSATDLGKDFGGGNPMIKKVFDLFGQKAEIGSWPTLMAATADLPGSSYVGPQDLFQMRGKPKVVGSNSLSRNKSVQAKLWQRSEEATGISYP